MLLHNHQCSSCQPLSMQIVGHCPQAASSPATTCLCCSYCWLVVERLSAACFCHQTLWCNCQHSLLLVAFAANCQPLPSGGLDTSHHLLFAAPVIGWLLHCYILPLPSFVITRCHATVITLVVSPFCCQSSTAVLRRSRHQPPPAFAAPGVVWLLHFYSPPFLSLHTIVQSSTFLLPTPFSANCQLLLSGGLVTSRHLPLPLLMMVDCCFLC
jgi:hypothetical protein